MPPTYNPDFKLHEWLAQEPIPEEIEYKDGGAYIPIEFIKAKLDILDPSWSTKNFNHFYFQDLSGAWKCSGNVELCVKYEVTVRDENMIPKSSTKQIERTISGAATFDTMQYEKEGNNHFGAVCLSLCIVSAAQNIAPFFGKNINKKSEEPQKDNKDKMRDTLKKLNIK